MKLQKMWAQVEIMVTHGTDDCQPYHHNFTKYPGFLQHFLIPNTSTRKLAGPKFHRIIRHFETKNFKDRKIPQSNVDLGYTKIIHETLPRTRRPFFSQIKSLRPIHCCVISHFLVNFIPFLHMETRNNNFFLDYLKQPDFWSNAIMGRPRFFLVSFRSAKVNSDF